MSNSARRPVFTPLAPLALLSLLAPFALLTLPTFILLGCREPSHPASSGNPEASHAGFVGREACAACHPAQAALWTGSDHDRAMEEATDSTVLGRFGGDSLLHHGQVSRFKKQDDRFVIQTEGTDGAPGEYPVRYTFGVRPLQQYLVDFPDGRMQASSLAFDTRKQEWFHLYPDRKIPPDDWLHWTRDGQNWNGMCADCHSTGLERRYDPAKDSFATTWKEIDVACEACHGPGGEHARWARMSRFFRAFSRHGPADRYGMVQDHHGRDSRGEVMACARCHARRTALKVDYGYAREFQDEFDLELLRPGIYHADGQILEEDYEYGSFLQSRMNRMGVRCSDCHDPHSLRMRAPGNALCTRCHEPARFDAPSHHRHAAGSAGSLCVECHMPAKTYMQVDARRDHSLRIPRPDLSVEFGTPNACNACHADKDAAWAAQKVVEWHGPSRKPHFSELLARGRSGGPGSDSALARLAADTAFPGIARATALDLAAYMGQLASAALILGAKDADGLVRRAAAAGLEALPEDIRVPTLLPLLSDSLRAVRAAAAQSLLADAHRIPDASRPAFGQALGEYRQTLAATAHFPGGRYNAARFHERANRPDSAVLEYAAALRLDSRLAPARINLAQLLHRMGRPLEAENHFREAMRLNPEYAETPYLLGLLMAESGRWDSAAASLGLATRKMPLNPRAFYNHGLALQKLGRTAEAENSLEKASDLAPEDPDLGYALAWIRFTLGRYDRAEAALLRVETVAPGYPGLSALARETALRVRRPKQPSR